MSTTEISDAAVDAAYEAMYGQMQVEGEARAKVRVAIRHGLEAAAPHLLSDPGAKKLGPFVRESDTSRLAALAAYPDSDRHRKAVLGHVAATLGDGATREAIADGLGMNPNTVRPRVAELRAGGWLVPLVRDGKPVRRPTAGGRTAEVLVVSEIGRRRLAQREAA